MADYNGMAMEQLQQIASAEAQNAQHLTQGAQFWQATPAAIAQNRSNLDRATSRLGEQWRDPTFASAFRAPVDQGLDSMRSSEEIITSAKPAETLQALGSQAQTTGTNVNQLYQAHVQLQQVEQQLMQLVQQAPLAAIIVLPLIQQIQQQKEQLRQQAAGQVTSLGQGYSQAQGSVQAAGTGHQWRGPNGVGAARAAAPGTVPSGGVGGTEEYGQQGLPQQPGGQAVPGGQAPQGGDTGLAGGAVAPPAAPLPATSPPAAVPPATAAPITPVAPVTPVGAGAAGAGAVGRAVAASPASSGSSAGGRSGSSGSGSIPRAAQVANGITTAGSGKAPTVPTGATGVTKAVGGQAPAVPYGGMPMLSPALGNLGNLENLLKQLKPVLPQQGGDGSEPANRIAGVPRSLRGRTGRQDDAEFTMAPRSSARSRRQQDDELETVELLDEEIWQVKQENAAKEKQVS